jgi:beta-mannosidase
MRFVQKATLSIALFTIILLFSSCEKQNKTIDISKSDWFFHQQGTDKKLKAKLPGCVQTDLLANGEIEDPYYRTNEENLQWIGEKDWTYETAFSVDPALLKSKNVDIVFKGLDTYATVYLNDVNILNTDNYFREWRKNIKPILNKGKNKLKIKFTSPLKIEKYLKEHSKIPLQYDYAYTRKPAYHYGWDWGPVFITQGIWQPVKFEAWDKARFKNLWIYVQKLDKDAAELVLLYRIEASEATKVTINAECTNTGETKSNTFYLKKGDNKAGLFFTIENPKLWWPNGMGEQFLYSFKSSMKINFQTVDTISQSTGLRTIKLIQEPDSLGKSFYFEVNGKPVYIKGANYIPQDMFVNRPDANNYKQLIKSVKEANMNMLRVWGGGFYEKDIFYELCDKNGIMVWQDFMFACAMYPGNNKFLDNVKKEADYQITRLRNHPSIALWCGNNEIYEAWNNWGWPKQYNKKDSAIVWNNYKKIFEEILPDAVRNNDNRDYWPSSPLTNWGEKANTQGDTHYWGVWHGQKTFEEMKKPEHIGRFVSEFGFQSLPEYNSVKKFTEPQDRNINSKVMLLHQKHKIGYPIIDKYMDWYFKKPKDFKAYIYVSQVMQSFGMDMGIEAQRRAKPMCIGTLYWQLNDCYPVASWSSIDYYGKWKALHYKVKDIYKPVLVSPVKENGKINVYVISDKQKPIKALLLIELYDFNGKLLNKYDKVITIPENSSKIYFTEDIKSIVNMHSENDVILITKLLTPETTISENNFLFVYPKDLKLKKPNITFDYKKVDVGYKLIFTTNTFAKNVYLSSVSDSGFFTDNYFDLLPGLPVTITFKTNRKFDDIKKEITIYSLIDSYM